MNRYEVEDGRGEIRLVCPFSAAVAETGLPPEQIASSDRRATFWRSAFGAGVLFTIIMTLVLGTVVGLMHGSKVWGRLIPWMPVMFVGYGAPIGYIASRYGWRSAGAGRDALLDAGLCPHCAHGIAGIPPESDGCTVCPECAAAWRTEPTYPNPEQDDREAR
ncbi:MAG: hypothetical protein AAGA55_12315 [Planctomycetota bacterium]